MKRMISLLALLSLTAVFLGGCNAVNSSVTPSASPDTSSGPPHTTKVPATVYKGDPNYVYDAVPEFLDNSDENPVITYSLGEKTNLKDVTEEPGSDYIMLIIDGKLVPKAGVILRDGIYYALLETMEKWFGGSVRLDDKVQTIDGTAYVSLDMISAALGATSVYMDRAGFSEDFSESLWVDFPFPFPLVTIDPPHDGASYDTSDEAIRIAKDVLMTGYDNYSDVVRKAEWYPENREVNEQTLESIKTSIEGTFYVGEISRYYVLWGPYEMLFDKYTRDIYFYQPTMNQFAINSYTYTDDPDLFTLYYFAG